MGVRNAASGRARACVLGEWGVGRSYLWREGSPGIHYNRPPWVLVAVVSVGIVRAGALILRSGTWLELRRVRSHRRMQWGAMSQHLALSARCICRRQASSGGLAAGSRAVRGCE